MHLHRLVQWLSPRSGTWSSALCCIRLQFNVVFRNSSVAFNDFGSLFEHRILDELLLDLIDQLELIQGEQAHHLDEARRKDLFLLNF